MTAKTTGRFGQYIRTIHDVSKKRTACEEQVVSGLQYGQEAAGLIQQM